MVFVKACDTEPRVELAADLIRERVAELEDLVRVYATLAFFRRQTFNVRIRQTVFDFKLASLREFEVEDVERRIQKSREQVASVPQYSERLAPDGANFGNEEIRDGVIDEVEALVGKRREVAHVAFDSFQFELVAFGDEAVLRELLGRVVEDCDARARGREYRRLLAAARREAEHFDAVHVFWKPFARRRLLLAQSNRPTPLPRLLDAFAAHGHSPFAAAPDFRIPSAAIVFSDVHYGN